MVELTSKALLDEGVIRKIVNDRAYAYVRNDSSLVWMQNVHTLCRKHPIKSVGTIWYNLHPYPRFSGIRVYRTGCLILTAVFDIIRRMQHRHIHNTDSFSSVAIDDIIDRGGRADWAILRDRSQTDKTVMDRIRRVCAAHISDPFDQKYRLWSLYAG